MENLVIFIVIVAIATVLLHNRAKKRERVVGKGDYEYTPTKEEKTDEGLNEPAGRE